MPTLTELAATAMHIDTYTDLPSATRVVDITSWRDDPSEVSIHMESEGVDIDELAALAKAVGADKIETLTASTATFRGVIARSVLGDNGVTVYFPADLIDALSETANLPIEE